MEIIKCLKCKSCLDLGTLENPTKKTSITNCFCHRGWWDGSDYIESMDEWDWNKCDDFQIIEKKSL